MPEVTTQEPVDLAKLLASVRLNAVQEPKPMVQDNFEKIFEEASPEERFISGFAALVFNADRAEGRMDKQAIQDLAGIIDDLIDDQLNEVFAHPDFKALESSWRAIEDLAKNTDFRSNIIISLLDMSKEEAGEDLELNAPDIGGSELFKKLYVAEYDQYGGKPYGALIGMYDFSSTRNDMLWLRTMGKIATACHAPFVASASPDFFGCASMAEVNQLRDLENLLSTPRYRAWNELRDSEEAAYLGLTLPRVIVRAPYDSETNPADDILFNENVRGDDDNEYLWGSSAMLFARNLTRSFAETGWCQFIRGPKAGGLLENLPSHSFNLRGEHEIKAPVEITMPDFREFELAKSGFIPLIQKKGSTDAVFYSAQSIKKAHTFKDPKDSENSQLVTNMSYTFSISRIAHYLKCIMRDNIGSTANALTIHTQIDRWIAGYTTALVNPDDLTLRYYPFKAYSLSVTDVPGKVGWYKCDLSVLPHIQFEGMDVDLRIDARLGK